MMLDFAAPLSDLMQGRNFPSLLVLWLSDQLSKSLPVRIVAKDCLARILVRGDVIASHNNEEALHSFLFFLLRQGKIPIPS